MAIRKRKMKVTELMNQLRRLKMHPCNHLRCGRLHQIGQAMSIHVDIEILQAQIEQALQMTIAFQRTWRFIAIDQGWVPFQRTHDVAEQ